MEFNSEYENCEDTKMDRDELILQKLSELAEDVKDLRKNVGGLQKDITDVKL